jgi:hypothetical protein
MCSHSSLCVANSYRQQVDGAISDDYNQAEAVDVIARTSWYSQPLAKNSTVVKGCRYALLLSLGNGLHNSAPRGLL